MSKARLLADLLTDEKITLSEVSGSSSTQDFNRNQSVYETDSYVQAKLDAIEDEFLLEIGVL